jgi:hypothetical protein
MVSKRCGRDDDGGGVDTKGSDGDAEPCSNDGD